MTHDYKGDARAAFMGLLFGALALFILVYGMVRYTNGKYASHKEAPTAQH